MSTGPNVVMRLNPADKRALEELARRVQRTQVDTIRVMIRASLAALQEQEEEMQAPNIKANSNHMHPARSS